MKFTINERREIDIPDDKLIDAYVGYVNHLISGSSVGYNRVYGTDLTGESLIRFAARLGIVDLPLYWIMAPLDPNAGYHYMDYWGVDIFAEDPLKKKETHE